VKSTRNALTPALRKQTEKLGIQMLPKVNNFLGISLPYDYKQIGVQYDTILGNDYELFFDYYSRFEHFGIKDTKSFEKLEAEYGVLMGRSKSNRDDYIFMGSDNLCKVVNGVTGNIVENNETIFKYISEEGISAPYEWCNLKILDKLIPIIFLLAYRFGFTTTLDYLKLKYRFVPARKKNDMKRTEMFIQFQDGKRIFDRYPLANSLIVAGLRFFPTMKQYRFDQLDDVDLFYQLLSDKGMSINYLKGIDNHFSFFIDPITRDVLQQMKEPTNTRDLLIRAVHMLVDNTDKVTSSLSNFRMRSTEKLPSIVYNEISRQYANHVNGNFKDTSFSINTEAIFQRIIQDPTMDLIEETNPVKSIKETNKLTYTGFGGRTSVAFVERDRNYPKDAIGILAETTTDSKSVGMTSALTGDPNILNLRGMLDTESTEHKSTTRILSDTTNLMPGVTHDD